MTLSNYIKNKRLNIIVKPNSKETKILGWDDSKKALKIAVNAKPEKGKANIELTRFLQKKLKRKITIKGLSSREKIITTH